jgi:hypothetical protein
MMSGLDATTDGPRDINQHHLAGAGEFSTGEMGNFQPALTWRACGPSCAALEW